MRYPAAWSLGPRQSLGLLKHLWHTRPTWRGATAELSLYSPPIGGPGYGRHLQGLRRIGRGEWVPLLVDLSVTDRCPYTCRRCSNVAGGSQDPSLADLLRLVDQLQKAGTTRVAFTGGEPLLREDLVSLVEACGETLSPLLYTSGYGLDAERARELRRAGLTAAFISLDHFLAEEHDYIRGRPGAFSAALDAIRACQEAGIYTATQAVVEPSLLAAGVLERYLEFCQRLGVDEVRLLEPVPVENGSPVACLDAEARKRLAKLHLQAAHDRSLPKISSMSWVEGPECLGCQAGFSFLYVSAQGEVFPCDFLPLSFGNVHQLGLAEIHRRFARCLKHPAPTCLALKLGNLYGDREVYPLAWGETEAIFRDYQPGPLPRLLRYLCHERRNDG